MMTKFLITDAGNILKRPSLIAIGEISSFYFRSLFCILKCLHYNPLVLILQLEQGQCISHPVAGQQSSALCIQGQSSQNLMCVTGNLIKTFLFQIQATWGLDSLISMNLLKDSFFPKQSHKRTVWFQSIKIMRKHNRQTCTTKFKEIIIGAHVRILTAHCLIPQQQY